MRSRASAFRVRSLRCDPVSSSAASALIRTDEIDKDFIVTAAPAYEPLAALRGQERFPHGRAIAAGS